MFVCNSLFVLRLLTVQKLNALFSMNAYKVSGPGFTSRCVNSIFDINAKSTNCVLYTILASTERLHFAVDSQFMHRRSHISINFSFAETFMLVLAVA